MSSTNQFQKLKEYKKITMATLRLSANFLFITFLDALKEKPNKSNLKE